MIYFERIIDAQTGKEIIREYSATEIAAIQENEKITQARIKEETEKEAKRQSALAKLAALGLTEDEIAAL